jgi:hypothetical protein
MDDTEGRGEKGTEREERERITERGEREPERERIVCMEKY